MTVINKTIGIIKARDSNTKRQDISKLFKAHSTIIKDIIEENNIKNV